MNIPDNSEFDAIVVGTGPGGATVARELSRKKKTVLLLERGPHPEIKGTFMQTIPMMRLHYPDKKLALTRGVTTGGSSMFYYATAFEPPFEMLARHDVDIRSEIEEIKTELPVAPLSDDLIGPMARRIMESAQGLGMEWQKLPKMIFQDKCRKDCWRCTYGCPFGAKWNARTFVEEAVKNGGTLINKAAVRNIITENGKASGVEYTKGGKTLKARAQEIIVAAGGIGTPRILRETGIHNAGNNFFFDPLVSVMGTVDDIKGGREIPMAAGIHFKDEGYVMTDLTLPPAIYASLAAGASKYGRLFAQPRTLSIMIKVKDELGGRLTESNKVKKSLSAGDREKLSGGARKARDILKSAGAKNIFKSAVSAAHPGGTAKIGDVVDSDLQTQIKHLYVCDCSVIPEAWGLPPTMTLVGLGKRLARHLTA